MISNNGVGRLMCCALVLLSVMLMSARCEGVSMPPKIGDKVETKLVEVYIPGTHDSGAIGGGLFSSCQDLSLAQQLEAGIRAFDLRLVDRYDGSGKMDIYHGIVKYPLEVTEDILPLFVSFLEAHPGEFLVLSFRKEDDRKGKPEHHDAYRTSLERALSAPGVKPYIYTGHLTPSTTVREVAGKMIVINRNRLSDGFPVPAYASFGDNRTFRSSLIWPGSSLPPFPVLVQDDYKVEDIIHKSDKKAAVESALKMAAETPGDQLNIFYISASGFITPRDVARTMNPYTLGLLRSMPEPPTGIYYVDFAGSEDGRALVQYLRQLNIK